MPSLIADGYVIDTGAIIDLWHRYPPDTFRSLWSRVERLIQEGRLLCPGQVLKELRRKDDDPADWVEKRRTALVTREDVKVWNIAQRIVASNPGLVDHTRMSSQADPFVIALAVSQGKGWCVVTSERSKGFGAVNIPSVCRKESVSCLSLLQLFAKEGWQL